MVSIAVVIPNFNQSHFLSSALESLRFQSANFNLAIMDGGSTDNFNAIAAKYSEMIFYMRSAPDGGQAAAIAKNGYDYAMKYHRSVHRIDEIFERIRKGF